MSRIISIHSFRGGTGKSNITANLATIIAQQGQRVGVIDTDIQSPGIHILFGLDEEQMDKALNDYLWGKCAVEETAYNVGAALKMGEGEVAVMGEGIYLIPPSLKAGEISRVLREGYDVSLLNDGFRELIGRLKLDYLFIDTDIQSPGIHILFGLDAERMDKALNDYLWGKCAVEETAYDVGEGKVTVMGGDIYIIPSSLKAGEISRVLREGYDVSLLNDGFRELISRLNLDCLFIDTHPGLNEETLLSIAISDVLLIILRPDQQDYQGTAVAVDVARKLNIPSMFLVVNKVLTSFDFAEVKRAMEKTYGCQVAGVLPLS